MQHIPWRPLKADRRALITQQLDANPTKVLTHTRQQYIDSLDVVRQLNDYTTDMPPHMSKNLKHNVNILDNWAEVREKRCSLLISSY